MLSPKLTSILLYAYPAMGHLIGTYKRKLNYLLGFQSNSSGENHIKADITCDRIIETQDMIENLMALRNAIGSALSFIPPEQREVIEALYFRGVTRDELAEQLQILPTTLRWRRDTAFDKIALFIEMFGFTEERITEYFDDVQIFIDCAAAVSMVDQRTASQRVKA